MDVQFLSLKSMHTLLVSNLSPEAEVEVCLQGITEDFNRELADFTLKNDDGNSWRPGSITGTSVATTVRSYFWDKWKPCESKIAALSLAADLQQRAMNDIKHRFYCLYWSYRSFTLNQGFPSNYPQDPCRETLGGVRLAAFNSHDSKPACVRPLFVAKTKAESKACDYQIPVVLPSKKDRLSKDMGLFEIDVIPKQNFDLEILIMEIFSNFIGCTVSIL
jgi:hypothetical protein